MRKGRNQFGMLAEAVAALALLLPLLALVIYASIQISNAYVIGRYMDEGAGIAARALAEEYHYNKKIVTDTSAQQAIFSNIRIKDMISSNEQFQIPAGGWNTASNPKTVTVIVTYIPGAGNPPNPPFPNPNILNLGSNFTISIPATFRLLE